MTTLDQKNTQALAHYLFELRGRPDGQENTIHQEADWQLHELIFTRASEQEQELGQS